MSVPRVTLPATGPLPQALLQRLQDAGGRARPHPGRSGEPRTVVVGVDGRSGAGKTALAARLTAELGWRVLALEDLYVGWHGLAEAPPRLCREVLAPLAAGRSGRYRRYDWHAGRLAEQVTVRPGGVLLVEGVGVLAAPCADRFAVRLWLEAPTPARRERALARDAGSYAPWWDHWARQEEALLGPVGTRPPADLVLDTTATATHLEE
ncbi:nucleoside/nucleotide kinase family protein [Ornithinicoccus halotolerans]|uniref:hypothetical protein n=1 Tax=Ornithinicoccus halotolerans TaxID=1748220 RepID=UPI00129554F6|nr:hypothetical protein [Ornithinicoccus halotolerans]